MFEKLWIKLFGKSESQRIVEAIAEKRQQRSELQRKLMLLNNYELAEMDNATMIETLAAVGDLNSAAMHEKINQVIQVRCDMLAQKYLSAK